MRRVRFGYYYHIPKTGGGSLVRYFGHLPEVELLRYEATIHVPKENKTLWYWEHQSSEDHWEKFVVPQALKPGKTLIAHHWGRFGMLGMEKRLRRLRERAEAKGCQFMASTTFREPIERDVSDEVFHRITGTGSARYLGDEQLRFFLLNSQRENARLPPDMAAREDVARDALDTAERILANHFDLVATIEDLELQKNAFLAFFDGKSPKKPDHRVAVGAGAGRGAETRGARRRDRRWGSPRGSPRRSRAARSWAPPSRGSRAGARAEGGGARGEARGGKAARRRESPPPRSGVVGG